MIGKKIDRCFVLMMNPLLEAEMKMRWIALVLAALLLSSGAALAELQLPGNDCFSPGLVRLNGKMQENPTVQVSAQIDVDDAFYTRDLSLLGEMLDGATFFYEGTGDMQSGSDGLVIERGGETLFSGALVYAQEGDTLVLNGCAFPMEGEREAFSALTGAQMSEGFWADAQMVMALFEGYPILERFALEDIAAYLESLEEGDVLPFGFKVAEPFAVEKTMSDDGTRLTRIAISGSIAREGETPWVVEGWLRQPVGRAPKDTFEITLTQDEDNFLELSYSCLRQSEVTRKNKAGEVKVDTSVKVAGKIGGSRITSRLTVYLRNSWTSDGTQLSEKITVSSTLTHQDNTPGRRMQRLNQVDAKVRNVIRITTTQEDEVLSLTDEATVEIVMDDNTFAAGSAKMSMQVGGQAQGIAVMPVQTAGEASMSLDQAVEAAVMDLAAGLYAQLDEDAREPVLKGL